MRSPRVPVAVAAAFLLGGLISPLRASAPEVVLAPGEAYTITVRAATAPPAAIATAAPTAAPAPASGPFAVPFGTRPVSGPIALSGAACRNIVIEGRTFRDLGPNVNAVRLDGCRNVTIRANDFINVAQGITAYNSTNVRVEWNRYSNITGPSTRDGTNRANFVQFVSASGGYIGHNKGKGGDTEDIISLYKSNGTSSSPLLVEDNHFEGTGWTSGSGSGIALGDGGGSYQVAQRNTLLNPGAVGIFIAGGTRNRILDNTVYGVQRPGSNVGLYVWAVSGGTCYGHEWSRNRVNWTRADGAQNHWWDGGNCGSIVASGNVIPAPLDPASLGVTL